MATYVATIQWKMENSEDFRKNRYSRAHTWSFDGGIEVPASSSPHVVPLPMSEENAVDPEEAFIASISSCHMLWFLSIAARSGFVVESYVDSAVGTMSKDDAGKIVIASVTLSPKTRFFGDKQPTFAELEVLHHEAHESCYIANSVKSEIHCKPVLELI
ncbi:MAG: OsmC family protein [Chloroflexi bacterium]|nr:OsmC family protein [Chloroflexota bacterium]